jgi:hypothetical protein
MQTATTTHSQTKSAGEAAPEAIHQPANDLLEYLKEYAREKPEVAALTCFAVGFVLGWKLKPW